MKTNPLQLALIIICLSGCQQEDIDLIKEDKKVITYQITSKEKSTFDNFPAVVEGNKQTDLSFKIKGEVTDINFEQGSLFKKGDVLATIDNTDYKIILYKAKAVFENDKRSFERTQLLLKKGLVSQSDYDRKEAALNVSSAAYNTARMNIKYTNLIAPFDGVIAGKYVDEKENISSGTPILNIIKNENNLIDISFNLPESYLSDINSSYKNLAIDVYFNRSENSNHAFKATFKNIRLIPNNNTRSYKVTLQMEKPKNFKVFSGMSALVKLDRSKLFNSGVKPICVPITAIFSDENKETDNNYNTWLLNKENMTVSKQSVVISKMTQHCFLISAGINYGDTVVIGGLDNLFEGMKVKEWVKESGI
ncbi:efflux RND transporter periplasmic adaptor subunit [Aliivibrio fischeri]|uniref:efflux RND transporter periplasmic adaptor subunit n=1 Tax=Aliivibrio fischeri TaxID=668 RepID=UPI0012D8FE7D|nr:efflux RND transporter periplasmic adaptor subunit [Aliivibrio fischeri]MUK28044.1 efflux RND transporter periplasmic adaptor subunit [Aliivibrio fischeri]MUK35010.1 efflux RND transporter periplasmic adaptor subunit [Aliivibrio fischeri]